MRWLPNSYFFALKRKKNLKNEMDIIMGNTVALCMCNNFKNGLPMHRTTTSTKNENDVKTTVKGPKKATMEFIKQFARAYQFNVELPRGLESMILN